MFLSTPQDAPHKAWLYRTLTAIVDDFYLFENLRFKGGTCAAMRGFLDRFSVDLDFDYVGETKDIKQINKHLENIFSDLGLEIKDHSQNVPQYFLRYKTPSSVIRNTLKVDITFPPPKNNKYETVLFDEIDRIIQTQTIESMFANKLVALIERFEKSNSIAGRDLYDIHHYFFQGYRYDSTIIQERRNIDNVRSFFLDLRDFVQDHISDRIITQDLNMLLPRDKFQKLRKNLKQEVIMFLGDMCESNF